MSSTFKYTDLVGLSSSWRVPLELVEVEGYSSVKMVGVHQPWSIKEREFAVLRETIMLNGLQRGFEVATAFGVSTLAIGLGFRETNGRVVTMDAYIEENRINSHGYIGEKDVTYADSKGFQSVCDIIDSFGLGDTVFPRVGWSPTDTGTSIAGAIDKPLDFVFIDAGHWDEALISDINGVLPYLDKERFVVFLHDIHGFTGECLRVVEGILGGPIVPVHSCRIPVGYNLSYVSRNVLVWDGEQHG